MFSRLIIAIILSVSSIIVSAERFQIITNITQFYQLSQTEALLKIPVCLTGVVTYADLGWNQLYIQDEKAGMYIAPIGLTSEPTPGDLIEIKARTTTDNGYVSINNLSIRTIKHGVSLTPIFVEEKDILSGRVSAMLVQTECTVRFLAKESDRIKIDLIKGNTRLISFIRKIPDPTFDINSLLGSKVMVTGVCANRWEGGTVASAGLFINDISKIKVLKAGITNLSSMPAVPIFKIPFTNELAESAKLIRVRGTVTAQRNSMFNLKDASGEILVRSYFSEPIELNKVYDVWGYPAIENNTVFIEDAQFKIVEQPKTEVQQAPGLEQNKEHIQIKTIKDVRILSKSLAAQGIPVKLFGVVTYADPNWNQFFLQDDTGAIYIHGWQEGVKAGQYVCVEAITHPGTVNRMLVQPKVTIISETNLPAALHIDLKTLHSETFDCAFIQAEGVVRRIDSWPGHTSIQLISEQGPFEAIICGESEYESIKHLTDSLIRITGVCAAIVNNRDQIVGVQIRVPDKKFMEVIEKPYSDPFAIEKKSIRTILNTPPSLLGLHRVKIIGTVTMSLGGYKLIVQDETGAVLVSYTGSGYYPVGDTVEIVGFVKYSEFAPEIEQAIIQKAKTKLDIKPKRIIADEVLPNGKYHQELVEIEGSLLSDAGGSAAPTFLVQSGITTFAARLETPNKLSKPELFKAGTLLRFQGICWIQTNEQKEPISFVILLRTPQDITILQKPPWWTLKHTLTTITILLAIAIASFIWIVSLKSQVRKQTEIIKEKIQKETLLEFRYKDLFENSNYFIVTTDLNGNITSVNNMAQEVFGFSKEELHNKSFAELIDPSKKADWDNWKNSVIDNQYSKPIEISIKPKNKNPLIVRIYGRIVNYNNANTELFISGIDITEEKRIQQEKEKIQQQLFHAQKLDSIGRLASGVAHDFNNMLQVILGNASLALSRVSMASEVYEELLEIKKAANKSAELTRQLLGFARKQATQPRVLNLNSTISNTLKMLERLVGENIQIEWKPATDVCFIKIDPTQMDQILTNLVVNAKDAIKDFGKIRIETSLSTIDEEAAKHKPDIPPGDYVILSISDTGSGMSKEVMDHIFEPFFTTKPSGSGTGLGLATVYGIVKQNNGHITVYSEVGKGTTFKLYFPREKETEFELKRNGYVPIDKGKGTLLIVEDNKQIITIIEKALKDSGFEVFVASTAQEAISIAKKLNRHLNLLISDVIMPEMNGKELSLKILEFCPNAKCLFMSGYPIDLVSYHGILEKGVNFIEKPFNSQDLVAKVESILFQNTKMNNENLS